MSPKKKPAPPPRESRFLPTKTTDQHHPDGSLYCSVSNAQVEHSIVPRNDGGAS
jgi:hypothetical protein